MYYKIVIFNIANVLNNVFTFVFYPIQPFSLLKNVIKPVNRFVLCKLIE